MKDDKITYSLRFLNINYEQILLIKENFPDLYFRSSNSGYEDKNKYVLIFKFTEVNLAIFEKIIFEYLSNNELDLFVSITSYKEITGISIPKEILNLIKKHDYKIEISIINLMDVDNNK
jgi:hypothetical protein